MPTIKGCSKTPPAEYEVSIGQEQQASYDTSRNLDQLVRDTVIAGSKKKPPIGTNYTALVKY